MPRDSIGRRVARAAATGGSKSYKSRTPWGWYAILMIVCVLGVGLIAFSRHERIARVNAPSTTSSTTTTPNTTPPTASDHWQVALAADICGKVQNLPKSTVAGSGLTTAGNGVLNIEPALAGTNASEYEGSNANLGKFLTQEGVELQDTSITLPKSLGSLAGTYKNGDRCGSTPGQVQVSIWASTTSRPVTVTQSLPQATFANGEMFMVSFVPKGAKVPAPPGKPLVEVFVRAHPSGTVGSPATTTTAPGSVTTTTAAGGTTTTTTTGGAGSKSTTTTSSASGGNTTTTKG